MAALICKQCGAECPPASLMCRRCGRSFPRDQGDSDTQIKSALSFAPAAALRFDSNLLSCWVAALLLLLVFAWVREPSTGMWADFAGVAAVSILLSVASQIPRLGGCGDLSIGGISALASLASHKLFNSGTVASILSGLIVGFVFGMGLAVHGFQSQRQSWWVTGYVGLLALLSAATWQFHGNPQPPRPDLALPGQATGALTVLVPAMGALIGLYIVIYRSHFGQRLRSRPTIENVVEGEEVVRGAYLISGIISGFTGACSGALLADFGLSHAAMFALSPLALMFLSGSSLQHRVPRLRNLPIAGLTYAALIYLIAVPGWTRNVNIAKASWERSTPSLHFLDALSGLGISLVLTALLIFLDQLKRSPEKEDRTATDQQPLPRPAACGGATVSQHLGQSSVPHKPRLGLPLTVAMVGGLMLLGLSLVFHSEPNCVILAQTRGEVRKLVSGSRPSRTLKAGELVVIGESLMTGVDGSALLRLPGKNSLRVDPSTITSFQLLSAPDTNRRKTQILLASGRVWLDVRPQSVDFPSSLFEVRTPDAMAMAEGTQFSAEAKAGQSTMTVKEGGIQVVAGREIMSVGAGEKCTVSQKRDLHDITKMSEEEAREWVDRSTELDRAQPRHLPRSLGKVLLVALVAFIGAGVVADISYTKRRSRRPGLEP